MHSGLREAAFHRIPVHELSQQARAFLTRHVRSIEELIVLLALIESDERWWDVRSMALRSGLSRRDTRQVLEGFASRNLLAIGISDEVRYQLRPGTPGLEAGVNALALACGRWQSAVFAWVRAQSLRGTTDAVEGFRFTGSERRRK
jgi:hypothetical protein